MIDIDQEEIIDTLQSGACKGGDFAFDKEAKLAKHSIRHYSFLNHKIDVKDNIVELNVSQLLEADPFLKKANETLKRKIPTKTKEYVTNLLRRNYWQIKDTERVYAVAPIADDDLIEGGTGWAIQMAVDKQIKEIYVFDLYDNVWYQRDYKLFNSKWITVDPPKPHGIYTGIGSRELTEAGQKAIANLYG